MSQPQAVLSKHDRNIDFLRFIFCILVIIFHMYHDNLASIYGQLNEYQYFAKNTSRSWVIVELFFIISGYYFYTTPFFKISFKDFFIKKVMRLWPLFAFATLLESRFHFSFDTIMRLMFFQCNGFSLNYKGINWFVSSLFWCLIFYFLLIKLVHKKYILFIISLMVYFSYVYLINYGFARETKEIFSIGLIRGIAGVGLGYIFHDFCLKLSQNTIQRIKEKNIVFSLLETIILGFFIYSFLHGIKYENNFIFVIVFLLLMFSFVFRIGVLSKFLDKDFFSLLGKYTYAFYVMQQTSFFVSVFILKKVKMNFYIGSIFTLIISLVIGIISYKFVHWIFKKINFSKI